jgi:glycosyltransferase involved in cell wall biosynthesis
VEEIQKQSQNYKSDIDFDAGTKNIIFIGRLSEQKGVDTLLNIIEKIGRMEDLSEKMRLNIFGSGDAKYETELKKLSKKFTFIRYFGHVENKYMPHILSQQDLMIAPYKWETLPYSILEAQGIGLPLVAFDIPGPSDIIENGKTGFLAKNEDEFFEKVRDIINGEISFNKSAIFQNIENKFAPEKIYSELINMFQEYSK